MIGLSCENEFCVYEKNGFCILEKVQLDARGSCADCIYITVEDDDLASLKTSLLNSL